MPSRNTWNRPTEKPRNRFKPDKSKLKGLLRSWRIKNGSLNRQRGPDKRSRGRSRKRNIEFKSKKKHKSRLSPSKRRRQSNWRKQGRSRKKP